MSEERHPVHMLIADLTRPESRAALQEYTRSGELADRIRAIGEGGVRFVAVMVGSAVVVVPLTTPKELVSLQRILVDLAVNLGMVSPMPLELDDATHKLLVDDLDMQTLSAREIAGHA